MSRDEMIEYIIELEGDKKRVMLLTKPMGDIQVKKMYEMMVRQQENILMEAAFS